MEKTIDYEDDSVAEIFDAVSHPTRMRILRALSGRPMGFGDLKRSLEIKSPGNLSHHLGKLIGFVETDHQGLYSLTDRGKEAVYAFERTLTQKGDFEVSATILLGILLVAGIVTVILGAILALDANIAVFVTPKAGTASFDEGLRVIFSPVVAYEPMFGYGQKLLASIVTWLGAGLASLAVSLTYLRRRKKKKSNS